MAYIDDYAISQNEDFRKRVKMAMLKIAGNVCKGDYTDDPVLLKRYNTAKWVIFNQAKAVDYVSALIASLGTLAVDCTDPDMAAAITSTLSDL